RGGEGPSFSSRSGPAGPYRRDTRHRASARSRGRGIPSRLAEPFAHVEKPALLIALGRIGTPECAEALAQSAEDSALWVRVCALHGLSEMRSPLTRKVGLSKL